MDIDHLHRELAKAILAADAEATQDTAAFVRRFLAGLNVGAGSEPASTLTEAQTAELEAWAERGIAQVHAGIAQAIQIGGLAGTMTSELAATLAEEAFTRTWQDGKQLSTRLWAWKAGNKQGVTLALQQGIRQMQGVSQTVYAMQRAIEANSGKLFDVVNQHQDDWVSELYSSAQTLIHDPKAQAQWNKTVAEIRGHVAQLAETGTKPAAERVLDQIVKGVAKGNADLVQSAVHWWIYDKQLYHLKRIVRTEMANAGHAAIIASTQDSEDVIGYQWRLSASHPFPDICDYYASIEMGLGKGVWPKGQEPKHKAHPHCMCLIVPRVTPVNAQGSVNYAEFIQNATPERQAQLLPKWAKEAMASGTKLAELLRPDGLGLVARQSWLDQTIAALESMADPEARQAIAKGVSSKVFKAFAEGSGEGSHVVARITPSIQAALGASVKTVRLSAYDRDKQVRKGIEAGRNRYDLVQAMIDRGQVIQYRERAVSIYLLEGDWYHAAIQATKNGGEVYLKSLRRTDPKQLERDRERGIIIQEG